MTILRPTLLALALLALTVQLPLSAAVPEPPADPPAHDHDIVKVAKANGFDTLVAAVEAAGLAETLMGEGPYTVFAPTDEAFAELPDGTLESLLKPENRDQLRAILTYHVVPGRVTAQDVMGLESAKTVQGAMLEVETRDGTVHINDATVTKADVQADNGVVHVIDSVLLPPSSE